MKAKLMYCESCNREVRVTWTAAPEHEGHANLPDGPELICLECGTPCSGHHCPITNLSHVVMHNRLEELKKSN
jgi:hypothetical protein